MGGAGWEGLGLCTLLADTSNSTPLSAGVGGGAEGRGWSPALKLFLRRPRLQMEGVAFGALPSHSSNAGLKERSKGNSNKVDGALGLAVGLGVVS